MTRYDAMLTPVINYQSALDKKPWQRFEDRLTFARDRAMCWGFVFWVLAATVVVFTKSDLAFVLVGAPFVPLWRAAKVNKRLLRALDRVAVRDQKRLHAVFDNLRSECLRNVRATQ